MGTDTLLVAGTGGIPKALPLWGEAILGDVQPEEGDLPRGDLLLFGVGLFGVTVREGGVAIPSWRGCVEPRRGGKPWR